MLLEVNNPYQKRHRHNRNALGAAFHCALCNVFFSYPGLCLPHLFKDTFVTSSPPYSSIENKIIINVGTDGRFAK